VSRLTNLGTKGKQTMNKFESALELRYKVARANKDQGKFFAVQQ
jgi:hypothetical protein